MAIDIYNLRRDFAVKLISKKLVTDVRIYRDHSSLITIEQKHRKTILQRDAFPNHMLDDKLLEWQNKGFTVS